jgi:UDP-glucose-4-epimerase GalE
LNERTLRSGAGLQAGAEMFGHVQCSRGRPMTVLVTGGAGYIGSHMVRCLKLAGRSVVVLDDLSTGHRDAVPEDVPFVEGDIADGDGVRETIRTYGVDAIVHFAAKIQVGESVVNPRLYYTENLGATISLLESALSSEVKAFILSSTAAVYGHPETDPIPEEEPTRPINPYGETKLAIEKMLASYASAYGLRYAALRYFNASGADAEAGLGERHEPESHLIPLVLDAASGLRDAITVFGRDYPTPDGTCIRDYIHVMDLAEAHLAALDHLQRGGESGAFNLGTGQGHSVREVIDTCRRVSGREIPVRFGDRRPGDPPSLVASPRRAERAFGWKAKRSDLESIVRDAFRFHEAHRARTAHAHSGVSPAAAATPPDADSQGKAPQDPRQKERNAHAR